MSDRRQLVEIIIERLQILYLFPKTTDLNQHLTSILYFDSNEKKAEHFLRYQ
jgi:hypothetical protein